MEASPNCKWENKPCVRLFRRNCRLKYDIQILHWEGMIYCTVSPCPRAVVTQMFELNFSMLLRRSSDNQKFWLSPSFALKCSSNIHFVIDKSALVDRQTEIFEHGKRKFVFLLRSLKLMDCCVPKRIKSPRQVIPIAGFDRQNQRDKIAEDKSSGLGFSRLYGRW